MQPSVFTDFTIGVHCVIKNTFLEFVAADDAALQVVHRRTKSLDDTALNCLSLGSTLSAFSAGTDDVSPTAAHGDDAVVYARRADSELVGLVPPVLSSEAQVADAAPLAHAEPVPTPPTMQLPPAMLAALAAPALLAAEAAAVHYTMPPALSSLLEPAAWDAVQASVQAGTDPLVDASGTRRGSGVPDCSDSASTESRWFQNLESGNLEAKGAPMAVEAWFNPETRPRRGRRFVKPPSQACKIFLGGISWITTPGSILQHFSRYGEVLDTAVMTKDGRSRGFGFVTFASEDAAASALSEPQAVDGRLVDAKPAVPSQVLSNVPSLSRRAARFRTARLAPH